MSSHSSPDGTCKHCPTEVQDGQGLTIMMPAGETLAPIMGECGGSDENPSPEPE